MCYVMREIEVDLWSYFSGSSITIWSVNFVWHRQIPSCGTTSILDVSDIGLRTLIFVICKWVVLLYITVTIFRVSLKTRHTIKVHFHSYRIILLPQSDSKYDNDIYYPLKFREQANFEREILIDPGKDNYSHYSSYLFQEKKFIF